jgi:hypothetical protein
MNLPGMGVLKRVCDGLSANLQDVIAHSHVQWVLAPLDDDIDLSSSVSRQFVRQF